MSVDVDKLKMWLTKRASEAYSNEADNLAGGQDYDEWQAESRGERQAYEHVIKYIRERQDDGGDE